MKLLFEILEQQKISDVFNTVKTGDDVVDMIDISDSFGESYYEKAEELFNTDKIKAFEYYKMSFKNEYWLSAYMLGYYYEVGFGDCIKSRALAVEFYKAGINLGDDRCYAQIANLVNDEFSAMYLWKKFFTSDLVSRYDFSLKDITTFDIDYRTIFVYEIKNKGNSKNIDLIKEILQIIKPSMKRDRDSLEFEMKTLLEEAQSDEDRNIYENVLYVIDSICNDNEEEILSPVEEDFGQKLDSLISKNKAR